MLKTTGHALSGHCFVMADAAPDMFSSGGQHSLPEDVTLLSWGSPAACLGEEAQAVVRQAVEVFAATLLVHLRLLGMGALPCPAWPPAAGRRPRVASGGLVLAGR